MTPKFTMAVSFGQILQMVTLAVAIFVWGARQDSRIAVNEYALKALNTQVVQLQTELRDAARAQAQGLSRIETLLKRTEPST